MGQWSGLSLAVDKDFRCKPTWLYHRLVLCHYVSIREWFRLLTYRHKECVTVTTQPIARLFFGLRLFVRQHDCAGCEKIEGQAIFVASLVQVAMGRWIQVSRVSECHSLCRRDIRFSGFDRQVWREEFG